MTIPLLLALVIAAPSLVDGVVAQVDGEPVLASELAPMVARGLSRTQAVEELIRQRLLDVDVAHAIGQLVKAARVERGIARDAQGEARDSEAPSYKTGRGVH